MSLRILHFSDVHLPVPPGAYRPPDILHPKRLLAALNYALRRGSKYADALQKLNGLNDFLRREPVDYILYTGDTLNFGLQREYTVAAPRLAETLALARQGALTVPGNHDLYTRASLALYHKYFSFPAAHSDLPEAATPTGYPRVRWMGEEVVAIAFNSARPNFNFWNSSGRVPARELDALGQLLNRPEIATRRHIFLMTHYPFDEAGRLHGLRNARALLRLLAGRENLVLLHGHNHRPSTYFLPESSTPIYCAGSLSKVNAEAFWLFELFGDTLNARRGTWRNARFCLAD
ncbi:MAG: metallophosphoesterase [Kiritimatiellae bacterium]|nr:metallophosphoesterase [Kiritimatiellia bacterium]MDD4340959.1 metallophosphoesterase [Kiritimatiellia bacterium]